MRKGANSSWLVFVFAIGLGLFLYFALTLTADVLLIGAKLHGVHPYAEPMFYSILLLVGCWLCLIPLLKVLLAPLIQTGFGNTHGEITALRKTAKRLYKDKSLPQNILVGLAGVVRSGKDPRDPVRAAIEVQQKGAEALIHQQAVIVLLATAISQNGPFDSISTFLINIRLIHKIVAHFGCRPSLPQLTRLYIEVLLASFLAEKVDDINFNHAFSHAGGLLDVIPGTRMLVDSALDAMWPAPVHVGIGHRVRRSILPRTEMFAQTMQKLKRKKRV